MKEITTIEEFNNTLQNNNLVFVDFWADFCGPCRMISPILEQLEEKYETITFCKCDIEVLSEITTTYNIRSIPTLILFQGHEIARQIGAVSKIQLEEFLNTHIETQTKEK